MSLNDFGPPKAYIGRFKSDPDPYLVLRPGAEEATVRALIRSAGFHHFDVLPGGPRYNVRYDDCTSLGPMLLLTEEQIVGLMHAWFGPTVAAA